VAVSSVPRLHSVGAPMLAVPEAHCQALRAPRPALSQQAVIEYDTL